VIRLLLFLAQRGLRQSRLILVLMVGAVAAGVAFQIPNTANAIGYRDEILEQGVVNGAGDVRIRPRAGPSLSGADELARQVAARPGFTAATPALFLPGAIGRGEGYRSAPVLGIDARAARLPYRLVAGEPLGPGDAGGVILGTTLARRLRARPGDAVQLRVILTVGEGLVDEDSVGRYTMTVRGIAAGSFVAPDSVIVDRAFLAGELGEPGSASLIYAWMDDHFAARAGALAVQAAHPEVEATAWMVDSPFLDSAIASAHVLTRLSAIMVLLAVVIPVWALLYIHVLHRQRQVGQLVALGIGRGEVFLIYLTQALIVGVIGTALGCAVGLGLVRWFAGHPIFHMEDFVIVPRLTWGVVLWPALLVLGATLLAGVVPAWRASRIDPARMLRGAE
jgi:ABC-type lipoprotein release transport system permease subunit